MESVNVIGIAWYALEDYPHVLAVMTDAHKRPRTYSQWRMQAEALEKKLQRAGKVVVRAEPTAADFVEWCRQRGLNVDANARMTWGAEAARRKAVAPDDKAH